jgi:drug/metabolite transporter (DMT)-like permease
MIIVSFCNLFGFFLVSQIPMSLLNILNSVGPAWVYILNFLLFGDKITIKIFCGIVISFFGVKAVVDSKDNVQSSFEYA